MEDKATISKPRIAKKIGTHDGTFHCDEVLASYLLKLTSQFKDAELIRTRDSSILDSLDCLIDVGGIYDPSRHRYDHHQRGFFQTLDQNHQTKLSTAGLIYKHFGREIISNILGLNNPQDIEAVFNFVYTNFIESIDAIDNGIAQSDGKPRYRVTTDLSCRIKFLNPAWNETDPDLESQFKKAMEVAGIEFIEKVNYCGKHWLPARIIVQQAMKEQKSYSPEGDILVLPQACPWASHLFEIEEELGIIGQVKYVLFSDHLKHWRIQSVPEDEGSFENRSPLPEPWRGKRDDDLSRLTGIEDCIFVHHSGFIGGNKTFDGVLKMAKLSISLLQKK
jgi:uncharacterized UPF0160 family protein